MTFRVFRFAMAVATITKDAWVGSEGGGGCGGIWAAAGEAAREAAAGAAGA